MKPISQKSRLNASFTTFFEMFLSSAARRGVGEATTALHIDCVYKTEAAACCDDQPPFKLRLNLHCSRLPPGTGQSSWFPTAGIGHTLIKSRHLIDALSKVPCRWTKGNRLVLQPRPAHRSPSANCVCVCVLCRCACTFERTPLSFRNMCARVCVLCVH